MESDRWEIVSRLDQIRVTEQTAGALFEALDDARRERLRRATAKRLAELRPYDFVWRRPLVSVVGDRPGD